MRVPSFARALGNKPTLATWILVVLLAACIVRLWLVPLPSSFWVDEMVTAFVVHYGSQHPSLAVAPQVTATVYYSLPRASEALFGFSETAFRIPSVLLMGIALILMARLASRLIHPQAAWFAVFACLALRAFNYQAADARPYALGTCVAAASALFLVRWLDTARRLDEFLFLLFGALLWRVHLIYWPFYLVLAAYAVLRLARRETPVPWLRSRRRVRSAGRPPGSGSVRRAGDRPPGEGARYRTAAHARRS